MDIKKILLGGAAGGFAAFLLSGIWHLAVAKGLYYTPGVTGIVRPEPILPLIFLGYLVLGIVMAYIYPFGYQGKSAVEEGIRFGIPFGLIMGFGIQISELGIFQFAQPSVLVAETFYRLFELSIAGIVIAMVYGKMGSAKKAGKKRR